MLAYKAIEMNEKDSDLSTEQITHLNIENMKKAIKSHRAALDFDKEFVIKSISVEGFSFKEEVDEKRPAKKRKLK